MSRADTRQRESGASVLHGQKGTVARNKKHPRDMASAPLGLHRFFKTSPETGSSNAT